MTLIIQKPTGAKLVLRKELPVDAEADAYIAAVEAADGQALEPGVKFAIKNFVLCCKDDGIWSAIKASCILAGARTRLGALTPLVGTAPTSFNFVDGDYNRKTGLVGDGSTKYLNSNRNNNADPQNSKHVSFYATTLATTAQFSIYVNSSSGSTLGRTQVAQGSTRTLASFRNNSDVLIPQEVAVSTGFIGVARSNSSQIVVRAAQSLTTQTQSSALLAIDENIGIYARATGASPPLFGDPRLAFYSIGESLNLALLDSRVTDLINAFAAAIP
jgi:hypothetical protein